MENRAMPPVGLKNLGSTGYLNVVIQMHFHIRAERKAIYSIPTEGNAPRGVIWALKRLYYSMQTSNSSVSTKELTDAFGWDNAILQEPQDAQEFNELYEETLLNLTSGTAAQEVLRNLTSGSERAYVTPSDHDKGSTRDCKFTTILADCSTSRTLHDCLREYTRRIKDDLAEGSIPVFRGTLIERFPPVMRFNLRRQTHDFARGCVHFYDGPFEYTEEIDLGEHLVPWCDRSEPWTYRLTSVVVYDENEEGAGAYYAYTRTTKDGPFYKLDDEHAAPVNLHEVLSDNYGGQSGKTSFATMLGYCRISKLDICRPSRRTRERLQHQHSSVG
ncbi:ubiquitin-specific protease ubp15 [Lecanicillium sp. MT-2017a]|nr:ubiquitin-specific protease ubp15 [Lecanicillium sp. MT-2017a]